MTNKKVLVVFFSQTGQLSNAIKTCLQPLVHSNIDVEFLELKPKQPFPFPWKIKEFLNVFPESVYCDKIELENINLKEKEYNLVVVAYQIWFLSPSLPISTFMQTDIAKKIMNNKPVITFIACRNMWLIAQEKMKKMIEKNSGVLLDNIVLTDRGNSIETFITTPRWMLTGKKDSFLKMSKAGVSKQDIVNSQRFGETIKIALENNLEKKLEPLLKNLGAVSVNDKMIMSEKIGHKSFVLWGALLKKLGTINISLRIFMLYIYMIFLVLMILTVVPISIVIRLLLYPFLKPSLKKQKIYFEQPSGSNYDKGI